MRWRCFRASTARSVGEDWHKRFVADLAERSPEFRAWWPQHDVRGSHAGPKLYDHPIAGRMAFEPMTLRYEDDAMLWVMIKVPVAETDTPAKLARLLAENPDGKPVTLARSGSRRRSAGRRPRRTEKQQGGPEE